MPPGLLTGIADPQLASALIAVHESLGASWTLEDMARHAAMSRSSFAALSRMVSQKIGQSPTAWPAGTK
ncbi:helix-turn-helix transcriptional regulator [Nocardia bhagyanarayanae]|uniref:helix-turn-helix transcriptional regulator n=1 Tax=Nocardia bhagyanarayanae TaxID=1215925 RepID=UPI00163ABF3B|nr:helix-turn-helix transcriptional regulator [Nocardia bhagyanarayanae]